MTLSSILLVFWNLILFIITVTLSGPDPED